MKVRVFTLLLFILALSAGPVYPHGEATDERDHSDYSRIIYQSYIDGKMTGWGNIISQMENEYSRVKDPELLRQIIFASYGYIGFQIGSGNDDEAYAYLERTIQYLDDLLLTSPDPPAWVYSMYSASLGFKLSFNPLKAPFIGPSVMSNIQKAIETDSLEPMGWLEMGNSYKYRPVVFGGSATRALTFYNKALGLFTSSGQDVINSWIYLNLHVQIAQCHTELKEYPQAMKVYEKVLEIEPGFSWVRDELKPELELMIEGISSR